MAAPMQTVLQQFSRLNISRLSLCRRLGARELHTQGHPLMFQVTEVLWAEPMKKRKKVDPAQVHAREMRKKKRLERMIKRLEKFARKLKPIEEIAGDPKIRREISLRQRERTALSFEESESRARLHKEWTRYKSKQYCTESGEIAQLITAQDRALQALREESEELYQQAIEIDESLINFSCKGPVRTPPIENFDSPDGEYIDTTKTYD
ncbi:hypothetical protein ScPMuIL_002966 [Solemya velum]